LKYFILEVFTYLIDLFEIYLFVYSEFSIKAYQKRFCQKTNYAFFLQVTVAIRKQDQVVFMVKSFKNQEKDIHSNKEDE